MTADVSRWQGHSSVRRGTSLWSRLLGQAFGFPAAGDQIPVEVTKTVTDSGEAWQRTFGARIFRSHLAATPHGMTERFGPFTFILGLTVENGVLHYPVDAGRLGPLPLPRWLLPSSEAREYVEGGVFRFDVKLRAPLTGDLLVHYQGTLTPATMDTRRPETST
ncbi:DUF4166 domain-containing protein [Aquicoccus porphyridii]|nr:DUF4166 domain-containing protein [Aquicoccus porphyridii]